MTPRAPESGPGTSFKGAALYYLHDKRSAEQAAAGETLLSSDRVAWTSTHNLATDDPDKAWRVMAATAMSQNELKAAAGEKAGKRCTKPVYAYSLSWHPDDQVDQAEMTRAAHNSLKALGFSDRQAILVGHNDTKHPHVHVIVNRIHPETGKATHAVPEMVVDGAKIPARKFELSKDHIALSKWAQGYQKQRGTEHLTPNRAKNNAARDAGQWVKDSKSMTRREYEQWKTAKAEIWKDQQAEREELWGHQKQQRGALTAARDARIAEHRADIKELYKPSWRNLYRHQNREMDELDTAMRNAVTRFMYWVKNPGGDRKGGITDMPRVVLSGAFNAVTNGSAMREALAARHAAQRQKLASRRDTKIRDAIKETNKAYKHDMATLRGAQAKDRDALREHYQRRRDDARDEIKERPEGESFRRAAEPDQVREEKPARGQSQGRSRERSRDDDAGGQGGGGGPGGAGGGPS